MIIIGCNTITFENLLVENSGRSGVDFIGCNNITINNLEAKNNGGAGIAVKASSSVMVSNITTSGNIWQEWLFTHMDSITLEDVIIYHLNNSSELN